MKLSIVIPVYQVAKTLPRCLDSISGQSFRDWQAILVDDASKDGSAAICDQYVKRDRRFQVVHLRKNGGLSAARNTGLEKARGQYVTFIDSDDYIADDTFKTLFEVLSTHPDYDLLEYPIYEHYGSKKIHLLQFPKKEYTNSMLYWLQGKAYEHTYACNKIYKREVFDGVKFPERRSFEDAATLPLVMRNCRIIATTDVGLYYYCYNPDGITEKATVRDLTFLLNTHTRMLKQVRNFLNRRRKKGELDDYASEYYSQVLNIQIDVYRAGGRLSKYFPILPYKNTFKLKLLHLLGLKRLCQLHKTFRRSH
ncbi:MAG: glycosyltransferase family 2 protein [Prevotella sp.]|nr:glycosyltransferase family 2 protein [Prevotella sp.]